MITATIHDCARSSCTSEMSAADVSSLSASGSITCPSGVICLRRRARYPSAQSVSDATPKISAPTMSLGRPRMSGPLSLVRSTTTSSGTRKMRVTVSEFGRFISGCARMITSVVVMKAILLAGGKGTRLRPLTVHTPKPILRISDGPFLHYQLDLLKQVPEIDEVILSLNYQPRRIEEIFGDGGESGLAIKYVVEPAPLGTAGAVRYAGDSLHESVVVFNGDVLTAVDLGAVIALHRRRKAKATIVLTPVDNPTAYGLVETDTDGNIQRFLEKPNPDEITCNTINAGIYVLEPETFDRIPRDTPWSIER